MMAETAVCDVCGAEVRDESSFCYNCGGSIKANADDLDRSVPDLLDGRSDEAKPAVADLEKFGDGQPAVDELARVGPGSRPGLRSAASLRKQRRASNRQPVEVTWERPSGPRIGFVITTIVLAAGALVLMLIALYLR